MVKAVKKTRAALHDTVLDLASFSLAEPTADALDLSVLDFKPEPKGAAILIEPGFGGKVYKKKVQRKTKKADKKASMKMKAAAFNDKLAERAIKQVTADKKKAALKASY